MVYLGLRDFDFGSARFLDLQSLVDQVAQHLQAQALHFLFVDLALVGGGDQRHALIHVGAGYHVAVHHRRGAAHVRIVVAEDLDVVGDDDCALRRLLRQPRGCGKAAGEHCDAAE